MALHLGYVERVVVVQDKEVRVGGTTEDIRRMECQYAALIMVKEQMALVEELFEEVVDVGVVLYC